MTGPLPRWAVTAKPHRADSEFPYPGSALTPYGYVVKCWAEEPDRFKFHPSPQPRAGTKHFALNVYAAGRRRYGCHALLKPRKGELTRAINGDEQMQPAFGSAQLGDVDVEIADGVTLEALPRFVAFNLRQAADAMALKTPMQGRPGQMLDARLQRVEAIIQGQQRMAPKSDHSRFFVLAQDS